MARYTVHMTFDTPGQPKRLKVTHRLLGRAGLIQLIGGDGRLAVSASWVSAESPADAAMSVVRTVVQHWPKSRGPLTMRSWTAHRERALLGRRGTGGSAWNGSRPFDGDDGDEGGSAGVREPRRPLPGPGSLHAAADLPGPHL